MTLGDILQLSEHPGHLATPKIRFLDAIKGVNAQRAVARAGTTTGTWLTDHRPDVGMDTTRSGISTPGEGILKTCSRKALTSTDWLDALDCCAARATTTASMPSRKPALATTPWSATVRQNASARTASPP